MGHTLDAITGATEMKTRWIEVTCDNCDANIGYYSPGDVATDVRADGGVVTGDQKQFCNKKCLSRYRRQQKLTAGEWVDE